MKALLQWLKRPELRYRVEAFGGIAMSEDPPLLLTLSRKGMRSMGVRTATQWAGPDPGPPSEQTGFRLSAPVEAHLALTNRCTAGCSHCYMSSGDPLPGELGREGMLAMVDRLADEGVFHIALGGGESFLLPWLFDVAEHARARGIVPNVTTSGLGMTAEKAARSTVFGRINVSLDGTGPQFYGELRSSQQFRQADTAIRMLRAHHDRVGINTVVTRQNFEHLEDVVAYAVDLGLDEVEFLRLKPAGRATDLYDSHRPTPEQNLALLPKLLALRKRHSIHLKVDCSFAPMVAAHDPDPEQLALFSVLGCEGGDYLIGVDAAGRRHPCSFEHGASEAVFDEYETYTRKPPEPCASCSYLKVCRGGCRVVAKYMTLDPGAPDPECPRVRAVG